jgi:hypothetical protein
MPPSLTLETSEQGVDKGIDRAQQMRERGSGRGYTYIGHVSDHRHHHIH